MACSLIRFSAPRCANASLLYTFLRFCGVLCHQCFGSRIGGLSHLQKQLKINKVLFSSVEPYSGLNKIEPSSVVLSLGFLNLPVGLCSGSCFALFFLNPAE
jgi:hypothetical protein